MSDLNTLVVFAKVVSMGSFSAAAKRLKMPVSTVSRRIAELENQLGVRLLERSTRKLRLTDIGAEVLEQAQKSAKISETVDSIVTNQLTEVTGNLRLSAPPNISASVIVPIVSAFQTIHPNVRVQVFVTDRIVDHISEGIDIAFRFGNLKNSALIARPVLHYRHQLVATPSYLEQHPILRHPTELLDHKLLAFSSSMGETSWEFTRNNEVCSVDFVPHLSMNDFSGLIAATLQDKGIAVIPPIVAPDMMRDGKLIELIPDWKLRSFDMSLIFLGNRHTSKAVRIFKEFAIQMLPKMFPDLPK